MALRIKLSRIGTKHRPVYRIVVGEARTRRDGRFCDSIGTYDPRSKTNICTLDLAKAESWIAKGATPTETVRSLIKKTRTEAAPAVSA